MFAEESSSNDSCSSSDESDAEKSTKLKKPTHKRPDLMTTFRANLKVQQNELNAKNFVRPSKKPTETVVVDDLFVIDASTGENQNKMAVHLRTKNSENKEDAVELNSRLGNETFKINKFKEKHQKSQKISDEKLKKVMEKSVITEEFLKRETVPPYYESSRAVAKKRKEEREKTKGKDWFGLPATELTEERKRDLEIMQFRDVLEPKKFYRHDDRKVLPKYFQIGTVVEDPSDFYSARIPKKQRKQTIVDELLADAEFRKNNKKKYSEIIAAKGSRVQKRRFKNKKQKMIH